MTSPTWASWIIACKCSSSDFDQVASLASEMAAYFQENEPSTTHFEWSVNVERDCVHIHERYADSAQALAHMSAFGERFGSRFMGLLQPQSVVVYGFPNAELSQALQGLTPQTLETFAGFAR